MMRQANLFVIVVLLVAFGRSSTTWPKSSERLRNRSNEELSPILLPPWTEREGRRIS
jgi:hypothetical protein